MSEHPPQSWTRGEFVVSTDPALLDVDFVHGWLTESSYWVPGIPRHTVAHALEHSLSCGLYVAASSRQIGLVRLITDYATFAYVCDVFVLDEFRAQGLGIWLMECATSHPALQGLRRWMLGTKDAHTLYEKTGFASLAIPERWMEKANPDIHRNP